MAGGSVSALTRWWFAPVPRARIAVLRRLAYLFVFVDVLLTTSWIGSHNRTPLSLYQPLLIGRLLDLPTPTSAFVDGVKVALLVAAGLGLLGRAPRLLGWLVFGLYLEWMVIGFSYGKVDHDRLSFLVLLAVLAICGPATLRDQEPDDGAGWAVRCIQVACVFTYFLAALAKLRFGGIAWLDSATLLRAVIRRGTSIGDVLADNPRTLHVGQYALVAAELASPALLVRGRIGRTALLIAAAFHAAVFLTIRIIFLPHLVAMAAFLPLERLRYAGRRPSAAPEVRTSSQVM